MYFCLNCTTGKEQETCDRVTRLLSGCMDGEFAVWFPSKEVQERRQGKFHTVSKPLFQSYIFIYWDGDSELDFPFSDVRDVPGALKFLGYDDGSHSLKGKDLGFAKWIHMHDGFIRQSKVVYKEGQRLHICEGPLTGFDGNVVKVDKHHKRITLRFQIGSTFSDVVFSVEFLDSSSKNESGKQY